MQRLSTKRLVTDALTAYSIKLMQLQLEQPLRALEYEEKLAQVDDLLLKLVSSEAYIIDDKVLG